MSRSEHLSEEFHDRVDEVADQLLAWAGQHCLNADGSLDTLTLGMALGRVTGACFSCLPPDVGWDGLRRVTAELHDAYREGRKVGNLN